MLKIYFSATFFLVEIESTCGNSFYIIVSLQFDMSEIDKQSNTDEL